MTTEQQLTQTEIKDLESRIKDDQEKPANTSESRVRIETSFENAIKNNDTIIHQ